MSTEDIIALKVGFAELQERLNNHCDTSIIFRKDLKDMITSVKQDIKSMHKGIDTRKEQCFKKARAYTDKAVKWVIAIPVAVLVLLKLLELFYEH